ncbi:EpsI family protein [Geomonas sp. RF6]|uniref:exosortase C-terminal domain/associated protein EpsI n=1 Tax=Geomonas sp. RF6 TaxID=2897342 RepID=UPI001E59312D|nr:exosortase C-terminal domain/associated protein EpsI [Geomonas sp. RF6]UFS68824.1 EpsI family protein [Geomonas sp. RF6]
MTVKSKAKHLVLIALLLVAGLAAAAPKEERHAEKRGPTLTAFPAQVGEWKMVTEDTSANSKEAKFLNEVLFRTYQRSDGKKVLLVVAYGADQRKKFNLHMPETCYKASGYQVMSQSKTTMHSPELKLKQLVVSADPVDTQPVQYWIMLDGKQVGSELEKRAKHLYYSVIGAQADGVLVRVSSFATAKTPDPDYQVQQEFIGSLYRSLDPQLKKLLFGAA